MSYDVSQEWNKTKHCIVQAAKPEALGNKKRLRKRSGTRLCNEEIEGAIKHTQPHYRIIVEILRNA